MSPIPFFNNWSAPMPLHRKFYLAVRNTWIKISKRQSCCGHPGEPGCWQGVPESHGSGDHHHSHQH